MKIKILITLLLLAWPVLAQQPTAEERVAKLKASLAASQTALKQYEWIETTVVSLKGEEKSREMERCYYGADGVMQKVPVTEPAPQEKKRGLRGRIEEREKKELTDYMKSAIALVKSYVPPKPDLIQASKDRGDMSVDVLEPGKLARLVFRDYIKPGDSLGIKVDLTNNHLLDLSVTSYLGETKDEVTLNARFATLDDGTTYANTITLDASAKNIQVQMDNSGYRKMN